MRNQCLGTGTHVGTGGGGARWVTRRTTCPVCKRTDIRVNVNGRIGAHVPELKK